MVLLINMLNWQKKLKPTSLDCLVIFKLRVILLNSIQTNLLLSLAIVRMLFLTFYSILPEEHGELAEKLEGIPAVSVIVVNLEYPIESPVKVTRSPL